MVHIPSSQRRASKAQYLAFKRYTAAAVLAAAGLCAVLKSSPAHAATYSWVGVGTSGGNGNFTDADWNTGGSSLAVNFGAATDSALFSKGSGTVTLSASGTTTFAGATITATGKAAYTISGGALSLGSITLAPAGNDGTNTYGITLISPLVGATNLVITAQNTTSSPASNQSNVNLIGSTSPTTFTGGITIANNSTPVTLALSSSQALSNSTVNILLDAAGTTASTIEVDASKCSITQVADPVFSGFYTIANNITLNGGATAVSNFQIAIAPSSTPTGNQFPNTIVYSGAITTPTIGGVQRSADLVVSNDYFGGGGKGSVVFTNTNNNWNGKLIINNNGTKSYFETVVGNNPANGGSVIPANTQLVFGLNSTVALSKPVGAFDLNGHDVTISALSSDMGTYSTLGITNNVNDQSIAPTLLPGVYFGYNGGTAHYSQLIINDPTGALNTFYSGPIQDGIGQDLAIAQNNFTQGNTAVGLTLAAGNLGSTTLTGNRDPVTGNPILTYSGPTAIRGGTLFVNGALSGTVINGTVVASTVTAYGGTTLAGVGSIAGAVTINTGATISPVSPALGVAGTVNAAVLIPGQLTLGGHVTIAAGTTLNWMLNDANAGQGVGNSFLNISQGSLLSLPSGASSVTVFAFGPASGLDFSSTQLWNVASNIPASALNVFQLTTSSSLATFLQGGTLGLVSGISNGVPLLQIQYTPAAGSTNLTWSGPSGQSESGAWNTATSSTTWLRSDGVLNQPFANGKVVNFNNQPTQMTSAITIQAGGVQPGLVKFNNATGFNYTFQGGSISGTATVLFGGTGHVTFLAGDTNAYTGGTVISGNGATLETQANSQLGTGRITLQTGGTWAITTASQSYSNDLVTNNGVINVAGGFSLTLSTTANQSLSDYVVSGSGSLTKDGLGSLTISPASNFISGFQSVANYSGDTIVKAGTLAFAGIPAFGGGVSISAGATLLFAQPSQYDATPNNAKTDFATAYTLFTPNGGSNALAGDIEIQNTTTFSFADGEYSGGGRILVDGGWAVINNSSNPPPPPEPGSFILGAGNLTSGNIVTIDNPIVLNYKNLTVATNSNEPFITYIGMSGSSSSLVLNGIVSGASSVEFAGAYTGGGAAAIALNAPNTYIGNTYIQTGGTAIITLGIDNALPATTELIFGDFINASTSTGFVDLGGHNQTLAGIASSFSGTGGITNSGANGTLTIANSSLSTTFASPIAGAITLKLDATYSGTLSLTSSNTFNGGLIINGGNLLVKKDSRIGDPANTISIGAGTLETSSNVSFSSSHTFTLTASSAAFQVDDSTTSIGGSIGGSGGLNKTGAGTLSLLGTNTYNGPTNVTAGKLTLATTAALPSSTDLSITNTGTSVTLAASGAIPAGTLSNVLQVHTLNMTPGSGTLDLNDNDAIISTGAVASTVQTFIANARNGGLWTGTSGITSSAAAGNPNQGLGYLKAADYQILTGNTSFDGVNLSTLPADAMLLKYTWNGDLNFDGTVNIDDYIQIDETMAKIASMTNALIAAGDSPTLAASIANSGWLWKDGDVNHDGQITPADYAMVDSAYAAALGGSTLAEGEISQHITEFGGDYLTAYNALNPTSPIPEPASLLLLTAGALGLMRRRRK